MILLPLATMHRIPKIFTSHSPERRRSRMDSGSARSASVAVAKPKKLDRRNAAKNIDYDFSPSTSASSSSYSYSSEESLRTHSADFYGGKTSFRVDGTDGEFDVICRTFGFSGIDDFQISPEEFETMKVRSSSAPVVFSQTFEPIIYQATQVSNYDCDAIDNKFQGNCGVSYMESSRANVGHDISQRFVDSVRVSDVGLSDDGNSIGRVSGIRENSIKGVRPPVLAPPYTPATIPVMNEKECSNWDTTQNPNLGRGFCLDEEAAKDVGSKMSDQDQDTARMARGENCRLLESCSFSTTSNDDDSSSTTTEPTLSISPNGRFRRIIKDWQKGELLGRGSFGSVYEGISDDGFFFAVKEVCLLDQGDEGKQRILQLEQEIALLSQFQHENIVQYYGTKKDESHLYIFLELITKGSLLSLYQKYNMRVSQVSAYTRQILRGLKYLHDKNVVHRDIKCANLLVHTNGLVKLADFGLAKAVKLNDVKSCKGTAFWMAPEVVRSQWYGLAADIWSLGCTVLEMLTRRFPYSNMECMAALYRIGKGERPPVPDTLSSEARDFILVCLQVDPSLRPTAAQLLDHPFVKRPLPSSSTASPHNFGRPV
ncbi:mitogen-activated protein kinase kinase kinase 1-like [Andrographis paniculata]|uniref:mitogen-activated protein kinase kinase kinase 1-like n=1 Tax=Andrographis paniculata TaxID=175694 RepID=UPI0021E86654|nr:mitogen-activated protein kinase kinase kinase 1-like [Andrographis paniculata]XP_051149893.1 mitogen-activated protein kinase kinase kinase 1-like [Andrographis paniculata]